MVIASIVGPVLILINQGDAVFGAAEFNVLKALLTVCVPFCVSVVSSLLAARRFGRVFAEHERSWAIDIARLQSQIEALETRDDAPERRRQG